MDVADRHVRGVSRPRRFRLPSRSSFSAADDGIIGHLRGNGSDGSPRDRDHRFYDRRSGLGQTDTSRTAVGSRLGASDGTGAPAFRQGDLGFRGTLAQLGYPSGVAACSRDSSQRERLAAVEESGPRAAAGFIRAERRHPWTDRSKARRFSSPWVSAAPAVAPWPLTGARGSVSRVTKVCDRKKLG